MHDLSGRDLALQRVQEADEFLMPVTGHVAPEDLAGQHVQRGEERRGSVALVVVGHGPAAPLLQRQARLRAVKRLNLALLIDAQHHRMGGRADVKPDDIVQLLDEGRIARQLEHPPAVGAQAVRPPDRVYCRGRQACRLSHRPQGPVRRFMRRRGVRQPDHLGGLVGRRLRRPGRAAFLPQQTIHAFGAEPVPPTPDAFPGLARRADDGHRAEPIAAKKHDPAAPDMLLSGGRVRNDRLKTSAII